MAHEGDGERTSELVGAVPSRLRSELRLSGRILRPNKTSSSHSESAALSSRHLRLPWHPRLATLSYAWNKGESGNSTPTLIGSPEKRAACFLSLPYRLYSSVDPTTLRDFRVALPHFF